MSISIGDLQVVYSGGASNTSQAASLGGAISTAGAKKVKSQAATAPSNVTGVVINDAMGNALGAGTLKWDQALTSLTWKPFGGVSFDGVVISQSGDYAIGTSAGYLLVTVTFGSLPGSTVQDTITITNEVNKAFDNISSLESLNGDIEYRCFYILNSHATEAAYDVRLWIKSQTTGADEIAIALDPNGVSVSARGPLSAEDDPTNVLTGITWSQVSSYATALVIGTMAAGAYQAFWIKRTVAPNTTSQEVNDVSSLAISALI